jgi:non-specific serine/threonine protein kinase/serine/threonine-protein kinase
VERQALALMNHANIAKIYEAGASEDGRPFFAMEIVDGPDIIEFCDSNCLSIDERLELFSEICSGVQHAHQKGVIHRDIKPSNVLVSSEDGRPVPKIIDFGVAKAVEQRLTERTLFTEMGHWIGTPEYMSPEQAEVSCADIDTRTDIYSLGVLLYELIAGTPPIDSSELRNAGFDEMRRRIREDDPVKPSTRVSRMGPSSLVAASNRRTDTPGLMRELRGDLDWIVLKALEKDRDRRYGSATAFAEDVARHLRHEPVVASPPSALYRIGKYVRRNRLGVISATLVIVAMLTAIIGTGIGLQQARREAETARKVSHFLESIILDLDPFSLRGQTSDPREILDRGLARIDSELSNEPLERARLLTAFGVAYNGLTDNERARKLLEESAAIRRDLLGPDHLDYASSLFYLGDLMIDLGDDEGAGLNYLQALAIFESKLPPGDIQTLLTIERVAITAYRTGGCEEASAMTARVAELVSSPTVEKSFEATGAAVACAAVSVVCGDETLAQSLLEYSGLADHGGSQPDSLHKAKVNLNYAVTLSLLGSSEQALPYAERAVAIWEKLGGPENREYFGSLGMLSSVLTDTGDYARARELLERALEAGQTSKAVGADLPATLYMLARVHALDGEKEKALERLRQSIGKGFFDSYMLTDEGFESLRGVPEYEAILEEIERKLAAERSAS